MKIGKAICLAIAGAALMLACAGVATASAAETTLCKSQQPLCTNAWSAGTEFTAKSTETLLETATSGTAKCEATLVVKTSKQAGEPLTATVPSLTWSNCTGYKKVETTVLPTATIAAESNGAGTLTLNGLEGMMREGPLGITCKFTMNNFPLAFTGGSGTAQFTANSGFTVSGFGCGTTGTFYAGASGKGKALAVTSAKVGTETIASPAVFAEQPSGPTSSHLCKVNESPCAAANQYPLGVAIKAEAQKVYFRGLFTNSYCTPSTVSFKATKEAGGSLSGEVTELSWGSCQDCAVQFTSKTPTTSLSATGGGSGALTTTSKTEIERSSCGLGLKCPMSMASGVSLKVIGGQLNNTAKVTAEKVPTSVSGAECEKYELFEANGVGTFGGTPYVVTEVNGSKTGSIFIE